nr:hypothetical protein REQ54_04406 [Rhizobium sp. Q54]
MLQIGQIASDFTLISTVGEIRFHDWLGSSARKKRYLRPVTL